MMKKSNINFYSGILIVLILGLTACSQSSRSSSPSKPSTPTPRPTKTLKPLSILSSTPEMIHLPLEIIYDIGGGGGPPGCGYFYEIGDLQVDGLPAILILNHEGIYARVGRETQGFTVCLVGMPINKPLLMFF